MPADNRARLAAKIGAPAAALVLAAVPLYEGTSLQLYFDPIGVVTYCTGATSKPAEGWDWKKKFTPQECDDILARDLYKSTDDISKCIAVTITPGEWAAWLSFSYNVGSTAFCGSTAAKKLNSGDHVGACNELPRWTYAGGKQWAGLVKRRASELLMCMSSLDQGNAK